MSSDPYLAEIFEPPTFEDCIDSLEDVFGMDEVEIEF